MSEETKKPPVHKVRFGSIEAAVWEQEGKNGKFLTISMHRNYKDKDDKWKQTNTLRVGDVKDVQCALEDCFEFARTQHKSKDTEEKSGE